MAGKDGGTWKHGYVPTNLAAAKLKAHGSASGAVSALSAARIGPSTARRKGKKMTSAQRRTAAPAVPQQFKDRVHAPGLSQSYATGKGATQADVTELARRYELMHGKKPAKKMLGKIRRSK